MQKEFNYKLDGETYKVIMTKKNNKNTYINIKEDLIIRVSTSYLTTKNDVIGMLDNNKSFLRKTIEKLKKRNDRNKEFYYLGKKYDIIKVPFDKVEIDGNKIYYPSDNKLSKWLKENMIRIFTERIDYYYNQFEENIPYPKIKIRTMKTRWGVNNKRDNSITLNSKLIRFDLFEIDYVVVHELSHFVHFDHSKAFWKTVSKYMPNYKDAIKVLNEG